MCDRADEERQARRLAIQFAGQCPIETRIAIRALELAADLVRDFIDGPVQLGGAAPVVIAVDTAPLRRKALS